MKLKIEDNNNFVKDSENFAVLNVNRNALTKHQQKMANLNKEKAIREEINTLKSDVSEIKAMLTALLERK